MGHQKVKQRGSEGEENSGTIPKNVKQREDGKNQ